MIGWQTHEWLKCNIPFLFCQSFMLPNVQYTHKEGVFSSAKIDVHLMEWDRLLGCTHQSLLTTKVVI